MKDVYMLDVGELYRVTQQETNVIIEDHRILQCTAVVRFHEA